MENNKLYNHLREKMISILWNSNYSLESGTLRFKGLMEDIEINWKELWKSDWEIRIIDHKNEYYISARGLRKIDKNAGFISYNKDIVEMINYYLKEIPEILNSEPIPIARVEKILDNPIRKKKVGFFKKKVIVENILLNRENKIKHKGEER
jgi:hypothetical protein